MELSETIIKSKTAQGLKTLYILYDSVFLMQHTTEVSTNAKTANLHLGFPPGYVLTPHVFSDPAHPAPGCLEPHSSPRWDRSASESDLCSSGQSGPQDS